jgi:hypothetical protein
MTLSEMLFGAPLLFGTSSFLMGDGGRANLSPDLVFAPALSAGTKSGRLVRGGLALHGCAVPSFTFRVVSWSCVCNV